MATTADDTGGTPSRAIRIADDLWKAAGDATRSARTDRTTVVREFLAWYIRRPGAQLPKRPGSTAGYTRPRGLFASQVRRGDQVAFSPGIDAAPITDTDTAADDRVQWVTVTRVRAGSSEEPLALEFGDAMPEIELDVAEHVVVREVGR